MLQQLFRCRLYNLNYLQRYYSKHKMEKVTTMAEKGQVIAEKGSKKWTQRPERPTRHKNLSKIDKYKSKIDKIQTSNSLFGNIICSGAYGHSKCFVLNTEFERYIFNCGETATKNYHVVLGSIHAANNMFFTYNSWSNIGGVVGAFVTMNEQIIRQEPVVFHGPTDVAKALSMNRHFVQLEAKGKGEYVKYRSIEEGAFEDGQVKVEYVKLVDNQPDEQKHDDTEKLPVNENGEREATKPGNEKYAVAFIVTPNALSRGVDKQKLANLNLKGIRGFCCSHNWSVCLTERFSESRRPSSGDRCRGPWVKDLKGGKPVTLLDGRVIQPDDLLGEVPDDRQPILVFECPTLGFLDSLISSEQLLSLSKDPGREPQLIVHMSPVHVTRDLRYKQFCDRFSSNVQHIMLNEECPLAINQSTLKIQKSLNLLQPSFFPMIRSCFTEKPTVQSHTGNVVKGSLDLVYRVRPLVHRGICYKDNLVPHDEEGSLDFWKEAIPDIHTQVFDLQKRIAAKTESCEVKMEYPKITVLGSSSAAPNLKRNTSALLLETRPDEYILLDCGEGTLCQLCYMYDQTKVATILANIKAIFISHLHYDHHGGVFNIYEARCKAQKDLQREETPLHIIAPYDYLQWLNMYHTTLNQDISRTILHNHENLLASTKSKFRKKELDDLLPLLSLKKLECLHVDHTKNSHALIVTHEDGWKLVYSGDCRPSRQLVQAGKDCDILIHEATFDDKLIERATYTKHCTSEEAIGVGKEMRAKFTLLTHFSQRMFIPEINDNFTEDVGIVFDFMTVTHRQLYGLPLLNPLLSDMFCDKIIDDNTPDMDAEETDNKRKASKTSDFDKSSGAKKKKKSFL